MSGVYIAGRGLDSSLGPNLTDALARLARGGVRPTRTALPSGAVWPLHATTEPPGEWFERTGRIVRRVAAESGALDGPRTGALFVASSSLDTGGREVALNHDFDFHGFCDDAVRWLDWRGPAFTVSTACTSSINAVLGAAALLRSGEVDEALVLGIEASNQLTLGGFGGMQLLSSERALPLGLGRSGLVLGEAVAALRLNREPSRWRVAGGANVVDGSDPAGAVRSAILLMCRRALQASGIDPADIDLVKLQAAGSLHNDANEVKAMRELFDPLPPLVSLKAGIGHTLGAAGAAEIALLTACIESGVWPAVDYEQDTSLEATLAATAPQGVRYLLCTILGFGGGHAALVLEQNETNGGAR